MKPLSLLDHFFIILGFIVESLSILAKSTGSFRGTKIGTEIGEIGIKVGSILSVYGEIKYNINKG